MKIWAMMVLGHLLLIESIKEFSKQIEIIFLKGEERDSQK